MLLLPLTLFSVRNNQEITASPAIFVAYLDSNKFYTDDIDSLLLLGLTLQLSNDDGKAEKFVSLFLSGNILYVAKPLKSTFYYTVVDSAVSNFRFRTSQQQ